MQKNLASHIEAADAIAALNSANNKKVIRWAVVGLGKISNRMSKVIQSVEGAELVACVSSSKERAIAYSQKHGIKHALTYDELEAQPELVDAVYICTHMNQHAAPAIRYLNKGLAVMVEKTFATSVAEAKSIIDAAIANDTLVMEGLWTRFLPATLAMLEVLQNDNVGKILSTKGRFEVGICHGPSSRVFNKAVGGGSVLDIGIYPATYTHMLLGVPEKIEAKGKLKKGVDLSCQAILTYPCGAKADIGSSVDFLTLKEFYIIECENATIKMPSFFDSRKVVVKYKDGRKSRTIKERKGISFGRRYHPDGFIPEIEHFNQLIRDGKKESPVMTHAVTLEVMEIMEEQLRQIGYYD